jgi:hypothetical protein
MKQKGFCEQKAAEAVAKLLNNDGEKIFSIKQLQTTFYWDEA